MEVNSKNRQVWLDLFKAAEVYRDLRPWEWLYDSDLFGVQNPVSGEVGYCCVLGNLGEHMALNLYVGPEGLNSYYEMLDYGQDDPTMAGLRQSCLSVSFEDRDMLSDVDRKLIKDLGLKYRGSNQWVMARDYAPGLLPWYINEEQAAFLTHALQQAVAMAIRAEEDPELLQFDEEKVLVRVPKQTEGGWVWEDEIRDMPEVDLYIALKPDPSVMKKAGHLKRAKGAMLISLSYAPAPARDNPQGRPFFPILAMLLDKSSGMILSFEMFRPEELQEKLQVWLVGALAEHAKCIPAQLILPNWFGAGLLEDIAEELDIDLIVAPDDPLFEEVMEVMFQFL